jgi:hypothetical protein
MEYCASFRECVRLSEGTGLRSHIISKTSQAANKFGPQSSKKFGKNFNTK